MQTVRCPSLWIQTDSGRLHPCRISAPGYFRYIAVAGTQFTDRASAIRHPHVGPIKRDPYGRHAYREGSKNLSVAGAHLAHLAGALGRDSRHPDVGTVKGRPSRKRAYSERSESLAVGGP